MLSSRENTINYISKITENLYGRKNQIRNVAEKIEKEYAIPASITMDYLSGRRGLDEATNFMLFCLLDKISSHLKIDNKLNDFFTKHEQEVFSSTKYENPPLKFPLILDMIRIDKDQWIGAVSAKRLMELRDSQIIWYNTNTQRTMTRIVRNEEEHWAITINKKAVGEIKDLLENNKYISNTITLNMPEDTDYVYANDKCKLIINHIEHFDIIDGYHRYLAISNAYNNNIKFDYPMELRITCYPQNKARQFIFQNNEQTKMSKIESDTFNQYRSSNMVIDRLNENNNCNLCGMINSSGIVDPGIMSAIIDLLYFKNTNDMKTVIKVTNDLRTKINTITEEDNSLLEQKWTKEFIVATFICFESNNTDLEFIRTVAKRIAEGKYNLSNLTTRQITRIRKEAF